MASSDSCVSTASSSDDIFALSMWNPIVELLFHFQIGGIFVLFMDKIDMARLALSCHFAVDVLCDASARAATQGRRPCTGRDGQHLQALAKKATTGLVSSILHCDAEMLTGPNKSIALQPLLFNSL